MFDRIFETRDHGFGPEPEDGDVPRDTGTSLIGQEGLCAVMQAVAHVTRDWIVHLSQPFHDETNLVVSPRDALGNVEPSFVIYRECDGFHLDQVQWDVCAPLGVYPDIASAAQAMIWHVTRAVESRAALDCPDPA